MRKTWDRCEKWELWMERAVTRAGESTFRLLASSGHHTTLHHISYIQPHFTYITVHHTTPHHTTLHIIHPKHTSPSQPFKSLDHYVPCSCYAALVPQCNISCCSVQMERRWGPNGMHGKKEATRIWSWSKQCWWCCGDIKYSRWARPGYVTLWRLERAVCGYSDKLLYYYYVIIWSYLTRDIKQTEVFLHDILEMKSIMSDE